jgi:hypothetical protein
LWLNGSKKRRGLDLGTRSELLPSRSGRFHLGEREAGIIEYEANEATNETKKLPLTGIEAGG